MSRFFKIVVLNLLLTFLISACSSAGKEQESTTPKDYELVITDSVVLERLSMVELVDVNEASEELLLFDIQTKEMLIINQDGQIEHQFAPFIDGPNYMGDNSFGWSFHGADSLVGYGRLDFNIFSKSGVRGRRIPYPEQVLGWMWLDYKPKMVVSYPAEGHQNLLAMVPGISKPSAKNASYHDSVSVLFNMDLKSGQNGRVFKKPTFSTYRTEGAFIDAAWPILAHQGGSRFAVTYQSDQYIYQYDALNDRLIDTLPIPAGYLPEFESVTFDSKERPERKSINKALIPLGDRLILFGGQIIPESVMRQVMTIDQWWESEELKQAQRQHGKEHHLLFDNDGFLGEVKIDIGQYAFNNIGTSDGHLWVRRIYEDERDYYTFLKLKIKE